MSVQALRAGLDDSAASGNATLESPAVVKAQETPPPVPSSGAIYHESTELGDVEHCHEPANSSDQAITREITPLLRGQDGEAPRIRGRARPRLTAAGLDRSGSWSTTTTDGSKGRPPTSVGSRKRPGSADMSVMLPLQPWPMDVAATTASAGVPAQFNVANLQVPPLSAHSELSGGYLNPVPSAAPTASIGAPGLSRAASLPPGYTAFGAASAPVPACAPVAPGPSAAGAAVPNREGMRTPTSSELAEHTVTVLPAPNYAVVAFFAFVGTAIRIGMSVTLTESPTSLEWNLLGTLVGPQVLGCAIMGWIVQGQDYLSRIYLPIYTGIATGLCGSITTFSGIIYLGWRPLLTRSSWFEVHPFFHGLLLVFLTFSCSFAAFRLGAVLGTRMRRIAFPQPHPDFAVAVVLKRGPWLTKLSSRDQSVCAATFVLAVVIWALCGALWPSRTVSMWLALAVSPFGAVLRYALANSFIPPKGTLYANWLGVLFLCAFQLIARFRPESEAAMAALIGGFCGCLSTVSSFVNDVHRMETVAAVKYIALSVIPSTVAVIVALGIPEYVG